MSEEDGVAIVSVPEKDEFVMTDSTAIDMEVCILYFPFPSRPLCEPVAEPRRTLGPFGRYGWCRRPSALDFNW